MYMQHTVYCTLHPHSFICAYQESGNIMGQLIQGQPMSLRILVSLKMSQFVKSPPKKWYSLLVDFPKANNKAQYTLAACSFNTAGLEKINEELRRSRCTKNPMLVQRPPPQSYGVPTRGGTPAPPEHICQLSQPLAKSTNRQTCFGQAPSAKACFSSLKKAFFPKRVGFCPNISTNIKANTGILHKCSSILWTHGV